MDLQCRSLDVKIATGGVALDRDARPVLLIHGAGMDRTVWNQQTRYLAHHGFAPIAVDLPGHGGSDGACHETIGSMAEWVNDFIDEIGMGPVRLVGHSMGCLICLLYTSPSPRD